jgi:CRP-like cAMP-binding protein
VRPPQYAYRNRLIRGLVAEDFEAISPFLEAVPLGFHLSLGVANRPIERICFPETGIISVVVAGKDLGELEIGVVGYEGMTGLAIVAGDTQSPEDIYVQAPGRGHWMHAEALASLLERHGAMSRAMRGFAHVFASQIAQTALANGRANIDVRLARWLLMAADRIGATDMPLTHDLLSVMLGVRRPGVTDALHRLEGDHFIQARRAAISIRNREGLEALAGGAYGVPEREYRRVLGSGFWAEPVGRTEPPATDAARLAN